MKTVEARELKPGMLVILHGEHASRTLLIKPVGTASLATRWRVYFIFQNSKLKMKPFLTEFTFYKGVKYSVLDPETASNEATTNEGGLMKVDWSAHV